MVEFSGQHRSSREVPVQQGGEGARGSEEREQGWFFQNFSAE